MAKGNASRKRLSSSKRMRGNIASLKKFRDAKKKKSEAVESEAVLTNDASVSSEIYDANVSFGSDQPTKLSDPSVSFEVDPANNPDVSSGSNQPDTNAFTEAGKIGLMEGNRIVDVAYFFETLKNICEHGGRFGCNFGNLTIQKEVTIGLTSKYILKCRMCREAFNLCTQRNFEDLNTTAVTGIMGIGAGFYNLEEFLSSINVPCMSSRTYQKYQRVVANGWNLAAQDAMKEAAATEAEFARLSDSVDEKGFPLIPVVVDGCWSKRSYRSGYSALSGAAAIVGQHTGKVLYLGVRNKFCSYCCRGDKYLTEPHACTKNYSGSSTSMEADILVEGFRKSVEMYGIKYNIMIGDGDSSTYKKLIENRPYDNLTVEKVECRNHLLRNFSNKLKGIINDTSIPLTERKLLEKKMLRMRTGIKYAIKYRKEEKNKAQASVHLRHDILNTLNHVFGQHEKCGQYFCKREGDENELPKLSQNIIDKIMSACHSIGKHARSLLFDVDSNIVEQFHSIVAKFVGGKRINYSLSDSYKTRCAAAVVSHNTRMAHTHFRKLHFGTRSTSKIIQRMEIRRNCKIQRQNLLRKQCSTLRQNKAHQQNKSSDADYGQNCQKPDLPDDIYELSKDEFLQRLQKNNEEIHNVEVETRLQSESGIWREERRKLLTSSNFARICKRRKNSNSAKLVEYLLYKSQGIRAKALEHGKKCEVITKNELAEQENFIIKPCGLFIDKETFFLGSSPDGMVGDDKIVEIKCPYTAFKNGMTPEQGIDAKNITFWKKMKNGHYHINKRHDWWYQIQGQLHIADKTECILCVWTGNGKTKMEYIQRDTDFWENDMKPKLKHFYLKCLMPELVDSRRFRKMPIRNIYL